MLWPLCAYSAFNICTVINAFSDPMFELAGFGGGFGGGAGGFAAAAGGAMPGVAPAPNPASSSSLATVDKIRNVFPETWLWTNSTVGYK